MASVRDCIEKLVAGGQITREMADEALGFYDRSQAEFSMRAGPASADAAAALETAKKMRERAAARQIQIATTVKAYQTGERRVLEDPRGRRFALAGMLTDDSFVGTTKLDALRKSDPTHPIFSGGNVNMRARATAKQLFGMMGADLHKFGTALVPNVKLINSSRNFIRERFGVSTGDAVSKGLSDAFGKVIDYGTARAKAAGKAFNELEDWRVSQPWTPNRVRQFDANEFVKDFRSEIANGGLKLFDKDTGVYATAGKYDEILRRAYSDIKTEGSANAPFSREMRTFQFQPGQLGADAWLRLQGKYGVGNEIMATVVNHLEGMAGEIALHEQFGGNPDAVFAGLMRLVKENPGDALRSTGFLTSPRTIKLTYDQLAGHGPGAADEGSARVWAGARALVGLATLRNLPLNIIPGDSITTLLAAKHLGMDGFKVLGEVFNGRLSKEDAAHLQIAAHGYMDYVNNTVRRYEDEINYSGLINKASRTVIKMTGADLWTTNIRQGALASMLNFLASQAGKRFDQLPEAVQRNFLGAYGFDAAAWDKIRASVPYEVGGAKYLDPSAIDPALSQRLMAAMEGQARYFAHQPDARTQAIMHQGTQAGTVPGELMRSLGQYKQFGLERMTTHLMRVLVDGPLENRVARGAAFAILSMAAGAVAIQAAAVLAGKDPLDMTRPKFWLDAFLRGGVGGLYGDMLQSALTGGRDTASILGQAAGPLPGMAVDAIETAAAPIRQAIDPTGKRSAEQTMANQAFAAGKRWTPSTWYTKLATDRLLWDKLQVLADPNYRQSFVRLQKNAQKQGSGFWWQPGTDAPQRPPDFLSAIGTSR